MHQLPPRVTPTQVAPLYRGGQQAARTTSAESTRRYSIIQTNARFSGPACVLLVVMFAEYLVKFSIDTVHCYITSRGNARCFQNVTMDVSVWKHCAL